MAFFGSQTTDTLALLAGEPSQTVAFTSDFLNFNATARDSVSLAFNLDPTMNGLSVGANGFLSDLDASETGIFSSVPLLCPDKNIIHLRFLYYK